jgi:hypothetical protein
MNEREISVSSFAVCPAVMGDIDECAELQRDEIDALAAIYPDTLRSSLVGSQLGFTIDVEVELESQGRDVVIHERQLPKRTHRGRRGGSGDARVPGERHSPHGQAAAPSSASSTDATTLKRTDCRLGHLPPVSLTLVFPPLYPLQEPPSVSVNSTWSLSSDSSWLDELTSELASLWSYDACGFLIVDSLAHYAETLSSDVIHLYPALRPSQGPTIKGGTSFAERLRLHDERRAKALFDVQSFPCGICLDDRKGKGCIRVSRCQHV